MRRHMTIAEVRPEIAAILLLLSPLHEGARIALQLCATADVVLAEGHPTACPR